MSCLIIRCLNWVAGHVISNVFPVLLKAINLNYELVKKGQDRLFFEMIIPQNVSHTFMQKSHRCYSLGF